jgi:hypothetical protein
MISSISGSNSGISGAGGSDWRAPHGKLELAGTLGVGVDFTSIELVEIVMVLAPELALAVMGLGGGLGGLAKEFGTGVVGIVVSFGRDLALGGMGLTRSAGKLGLDLGLDLGFAEGLEGQPEPEASFITLGVVGGWHARRA